MNSILKNNLNQLMSEQGIVDWGYTENIAAQTYDKFSSWVDEGNHGPLHYLSDHRKEARVDLTSVVNNAKSALCFLFTYHPQKLALEDFYQSEESNGLKIASYVTGFEGYDYHLLLRDKLTTIGEKVQENHPTPLNWRHSLDIQPVLERDLAYRAGLGWFGRNSMLISKEHGSFFIIGSLIFDDTLGLETRPLESDHCGQCNACVEACPTQAIDGNNRTLKANDCISTWSIELFKEGAPAPKGMEESGQYFFGCDICQDVCPWNKRPLRLGLQASDKSSFLQSIDKLKKAFLSPPLEKLIQKLEKKSNSGFSKEFKETSLGRTGRRGLLKNLQFWKKP